jgi:hypothetical protein
LRARPAAFAFSLLLLAGCGGLSTEDGKRAVEFGSNCYRIPVWNAALMDGSVFFPFSEGRKSTRSLTRRFSNAEIATRVVGETG